MDIANKLKTIDIVDIIVRELKDKSTLIIICQNEPMCDDLMYFFSNYPYKFTVGTTKSKNVGIILSFNHGSFGELKLEQNSDDYNKLSEILKGNVRYVSIAFRGENNRLSIFHQTYSLILSRNN